MKIFRLIYDVPAGFSREQDYDYIYYLINEKYIKGGIEKSVCFMRLFNESDDDIFERMKHTMAGFESYEIGDPIRFVKSTFKMIKGAEVLYDFT